MPENFTPEELADLNDLRRRIANGGEYNETEVAEAIKLFMDKRAEAAKVDKPKKKAASKRTTIDLDDMLDGT